MQSLEVYTRTWYMCDITLSPDVWTGTLTSRIVGARKLLAIEPAANRWDKILKRLFNLPQQRVCYQVSLPTIRIHIRLCA